MRLEVSSMPSKLIGEGNVLGLPVRFRGLTDVCRLNRILGDIPCRVVVARREIGAESPFPNLLEAELGRSPSTSPVPEALLRCQTRFRCELAKQTRSQLGIIALQM